MRVDHVGWRFAYVLEHRAAEERVPLRVIGLSIHAVAADPLVVTDEDSAHTVAHYARIRDTHLGLPVWDGARGRSIRDLELSPVDGLVERQVQRGVVTGRCECPRESARGVVERSGVRGGRGYV